MKIRLIRNIAVMYIHCTTETGVQISLAGVLSLAPEGHGSPPRSARTTTTSPSSFHSRGVSVPPVDQEGVVLTSEELTRRCLNCFEPSTWGYSKNHHRH